VRSAALWRAEASCIIAPRFDVVVPSNLSRTYGD
jgi:hypothetical protein